MPYTVDDAYNDDAIITTDSKIDSTAVQDRATLDGEWSSDTISTDVNFLRFLRSNGIYRRSDMQLFNSFHRFPRLDPYNVVTTTREYIFFIKPDLHLYNASGSLNPEISNNPIFSDLQSRGYQFVMEQLQSSVTAGQPYMNILSNRKTSNVDLPGVSADLATTNANMYGTKLNYRKGTESTDENIDFSVEFEDTKYLEIYTLFKIYDEYEKRKWYGTVSPPNKDYIINKVSHDKMGMFRFIVGEDGETILHWAQFWGVIPTSVPRDSLSDIPQDGHLKFTVSFKADFVDDLNPVTLSDFNHLSKTISCNTGCIPIFDVTNGYVSGENVTKPYIEWPQQVNTNKTPGNYGMYKLKWGGNL